MKKNSCKIHFLFILIILLFSCPIFAKSVKSSEGPEVIEEKAPDGKIIVLVVDISQSIRAQLPLILDGLSSQIIAVIFVTEVSF